MSDYLWGVFPEGIGLWGLWSKEGFNEGFSIWLEVTELWKVQLDWRVWATREPHGSYSLLWPCPIVALLLAASQDVSYSAEPSLLWWIAMSETMNSRNNSPIYLVSVRHSVKVTMKLTANFSKICSLRILSFSIQSFVQLQGLWSEVNRTGQVELLWRMTCVITQSSFSERWVLGTNLQIPEQGSFPCWLFPLFLTDSPQVKANWLMFRADWAFYALHSGLLRFLKTTSSCRKNICSAGDSQASLRVTDKWTACRAEAGSFPVGAAASGCGCHLQALACPHGWAVSNRWGKGGSSNLVSILCPSHQPQTVPALGSTASHFPKWSWWALMFLWLLIKSQRVNFMGTWRL